MSHAAGSETPALPAGEGAPRARRRREPLHRDMRRGLLGGVLAGVAPRLGLDPVVLRVLFVIATVATSGVLLLPYLVAWAVLPASGERGPALRPLARLPVRSEWRVGTGVGLLVLAVLLAFRQLGIWWSDALVWPLVLVAFGAALLWGRSRPPGAEPQAPPGGWAAGGPAAGAEGAVAAPPQRRGQPFAELYRGVFGVLLVVGAGLLVLSSNDIFGGVRDAALTAVVVIVAVALILAPFLWRLGRNLAAERAERVRSQERAEMAAHLHDSVLQTLTLVQKRAEHPREVAALARRQERELREWLADERRTPAGSSFAARLRTVAEEVEDDHRVAVDVVAVGDCEIDEGTEALLGAAREALLNAAEHAAEPGPIRVYAEIERDRVEVFVRDRGAGFDPAGVPADRRGVRESIVGRMRRAGGRAEVRSTPGSGTEVSLELPRPLAAPEADRG